MDAMLRERAVSCPYCAESMTLLIDPSAGSQLYVEDCQVCCQPMQVRVQVDFADDVIVEVDRDQ